MVIDFFTGEINWAPNASGIFEVKVKASDKEKYVVQEYSISVESTYLTSIEILPSPVMYLDMNQSMPIKSVKAFYDNGSSKEIELTNCTYESDRSDIVTVNENGIIKGVSNIISIPATITVSYTQDGISKDDSVIVIVNLPFIVFWGIDQACAF